MALTNLEFITVAIVLGSYYLLLHIGERFYD